MPEIHHCQKKVVCIAISSEESCFGGLLFKFFLRFDFTLFTQGALLGQDFSMSGSEDSLPSVSPSPFFSSAIEGRGRSALTSSGVGALVPERD